jgi:LemA protein
MYNYSGRVDFAGVDMTEILIIVVLLVLITAVWLYNRLVRNRNQVSEAWAGIDVQLQKRSELVPNLVQTVKGYAAHESDVLEGVARVRGGGSSHSSEDVAARAKQETQLSRSLGRLFALAEAYPDLKASEGFQQLHASLVDIEDQLQFARRYYNGAVRDNNNLVEGFPSNVIANMFKFNQAEFFEIELASQRSAPDVDL